MQTNSPTLFIEINNSEYAFAVGDEGENSNFKLIYKKIIPIQGIENNRIVEFDLVLSTIKNNIFIIEQKLNFIFKDIILIINNFNLSFISLAGFKKLNGSQILKENITYILNSLKSSIDEFEDQKTILHIFNLKYSLDKKKIENLPIGLFGNFYSHELVFSLISNNDYKNLNNIFDKCNLKIKKILLKSFVEGSYISNKNKNCDTFLHVKMNENNSQIFFFENYALKFEQKFNFGTDLVIRDISKIISLNKNITKNIIKNIISTKYENQDLIERELFENENYRKIKKKLIFDIAAARIQEYSEILIKKNVNLSSCLKTNKKIFLNINDKLNFECFKDSYYESFSNNDYFNVDFEENLNTEDLIINVNKLVRYGWKKEAVPIIHHNKSLIARFFHAIFR